MNEEQKRIAYKAIEANVEDSTARQVIRYVMECELWNQDTISPSNEYLEKKYGWSKDTTLVAISKAKKSQFVTTTGYGKNRCFELNVGHLKSKMAEIFQKSLRPKADFSDVLPNTLPKGLPNSSPNTLPNTFLIENGLTEPQNHQIEGYYNNSNNNNKEGETKVSQPFEVVSDAPPKQKSKVNKEAWALKEKLYDAVADELGVRPVPSMADYQRVLFALKHLKPDDIENLVRDGLDDGKKTVAEMLTTRSINIYLQDNA